MRGLERHDPEEASNFHKHEVEVPVLVLNKIRVVTVLAHHGQLSLGLDLLDTNLNVAEFATDDADLFLGHGQVLFSSENLLLCLYWIEFLHLRFYLMSLTIGSNIELDLLFLCLISV